MKVRFTPRAVGDLAGIADYIKQFSRQSSARVKNDILNTTRNIGRFPGVGRRQSVEGVRKLVSRRYAYLVYYTVDFERKEVAIISIRDPAREREFQDE